MRRYIPVFFVTLLCVGYAASDEVARAACNPTALERVQYGTQSPGVQVLQSCLIEGGYSIPAGATGYYGAQTRSAVQAFYAHALNLPTWDGLSVGPQGRAKLADLQGGSPDVSALSGYKRAGSASELTPYLAERDKSTSYSVTGVVPPMAPVTERDSTATGAANTTPARVSTTNVQVAGIDEPDIVKTDGSKIYISKQQGWGGIVRPMLDTPVTGVAVDAAMPIWQDPSKTRIIDAYPLSNLALVSDTIEEKGEMLLVKDTHTLIILSYPSIVTYDVSNPKTPVKKWSFALENNTSLVAARLTNNTLYLVTQTWLDRGTPCPYIPLTQGSTRISIPCTDIWIPRTIEPVDTTYTMLAVNPSTGIASHTLAFATESGNTTFSLFADNAYLATKSYRAPYAVMIDATLMAYKPYVSVSAYTNMTTIASYNISLAGKLSEITQVAEGELAHKEANERLRIQTEVQHTITTYLDAHKRDIDRTRVIRIALQTLSIAATGEIPGTLLNQFSLDEYNGALRAAVTVGNSWWGGGETTNDVYVLDMNLAERGSIKDLGLGERVYSARFMGDMAYLVTFKQVDPFYVLDLSVPTAPKLRGELKIPGYSAYLEPLENDRVLGVGREGNGVKLSVFDVSDPIQPQEISKYRIADSWTEVENNHHAFLRDPAHDIFFIPGSNGGYVFSYHDGTLSLKATIAGWSVHRAVYIDDYLYAIGDENITVLDENTWKEVKKLPL